VGRGQGPAGGVVQADADAARAVTGLDAAAVPDRPVEWVLKQFVTRWVDRLVRAAQTKQSRAARSVQAGYRFALTGTPVENNLGDLWSLMEFLNPGFLGAQAEFKRRFFMPIQTGGAPEAAERLKRITGSFILRRLKLVGLLHAGTPGESIASEPQAPSIEPQPLAMEPDAFWEGTDVHGEFAGEAVIPPVAAALPKRLESFPFWRAEESLLAAMEAICQKASDEGLTRIFHRGG